MPEFIDPEFTKTSPKRSFSISENERFGLVFAKTGSINSGTEEVGGLEVFLCSADQNFGHGLKIQTLINKI